MNELESILNYLETTSLEPHDDYTSEFTYKEQKLLWNYIKQLKEQLEASEKARKESMLILGEYRHYTLPTEEQNRENEDIVDKAYNNLILKQCLELTTNNDFGPPISAYDGVDIDDVVRTCKQLQDKKTYLDLVKENQSLKKQLEKKYSKIGTLMNEVLYEENTKLINQQKEFIKYLESEIGCRELISDSLFNHNKELKVYKEVLQKYKEIIGDDK